MRFDVSVGDVEGYASELIILPLFESDKLPQELKHLNQALKGELSELYRARIFRGKWNEVEFLPSLGHLTAKRLMLFGLGKKDDFTADRLRRAASLTARQARANKTKSYATLLHTVEMKQTTVEERARIIAEGTVLGTYQFNTYKTAERDKQGVEKVVFLEENNKRSADIRRGADTGMKIADVVNATKELVNMPASIVTPQYLADEAKKKGKEYGFKVTILDRKDMRKQGMNGIVAVGQGSSQEPKFVILEYSPKDAKKTIALAGKGITFDTGGLNLKATGYIEDMKSDMAGAAAVLGTVCLAAHFKIPIRIVAGLACAENMPDGNAQRPSDIVTAHNGKTIEVANTDAEGRLVLADALSYLEKTYKPDAMVDVATLTGACIIALGNVCAGVVGTDRKLLDTLRDAGTTTHERVWEMPFWDDYKDMVKGEWADVVSISKSGKMSPGMIFGGAFLNQFVEKTPWAHVDIAGTAFIQENRDYAVKGATGYGVRLMLETLQRIANEKK